MRKKHLLHDEMGNLHTKYAHQLAWTNALCARLNKHNKMKRYCLFNIQDVTLIIHQVASSMLMMKKISSVVFFFLYEKNP